MSSPVKKIPDMFLRAMKRKSVADARIHDAATGEQENESGLVSEKAAKTAKIETKPIKPTQLPVKKPSLSSTENVEIIECVEDSTIQLLSLITCEDWKTRLQSEFDKKYLKEVESFLQKEYKKGAKVFPPRNEIFTAFNLSRLQDIRVVIIGQDPYHDDNQAHGLCFSVKKGVKPPPSLKNIYKELATDIPGFVAPDHGFLEGWARQGVFMLNSTLTVEAHKANSHAKIGWQKFTDHVIGVISKEAPNNVVFLLWGGFAHKKEALIDGKRHAIVKTAHPSPLSARYWVGCKCFSKTNEHLEKFNLPPINWKDL